MLSATYYLQNIQKIRSSLYAASLRGILLLINCILADIIWPSWGSRFEKYAKIICTAITLIKNHIGDIGLSPLVTISDAVNKMIKITNCAAKFSTANVYGT